jgi:hypothetical protein
MRLEENINLQPVVETDFQSKIDVPDPQKAWGMGDKH